MAQLQEIEKLFRDNHKALYRVSFGIVRDEDACKDIVQDVFYQFWKSRDKIELGPGIKSYLYKATVNLSINYAKKIKRLTILGEEGLLPDQHRKTSDPHEETVASELKQNIDKAIDNLPSRCQTIFLMSRYEGMKYQEIADTLGLSIKTVENQMGIALKKLREDLEPYIVLDLVSAMVVFILLLLL